MTEFEMFQLLKKRYPNDAYAIFPQVYEGTGSLSGRCADAICMGLYPSRGLEMEGFEMKDSRADWLSELKKHSKADSIFKYCDRWWVVASKKDIVKIEELPPLWGLLVVNGECLKVAKAAPKLEPEQIPRKFLAAILRRAQEFKPSVEELKAKYDEGLKDGKAHEKLCFPNKYASLERMEVQVKAFESASGIDIASWRANGKELGEAVEIILSGKQKKIKSEFEWCEKRLSDVLKTVRDGIRGLDSLENFEVSK